MKFVNYEHHPTKVCFFFAFSISLIEKPDETWLIKKRYSDFVRLNEELARILRRKMPELPEKKLKILGFLIMFFF